MSICRICNHRGSLFQDSHYPECPFSNIEPKRDLSVPVRQIDYWLSGKDERKHIQKDFERGRLRHLGDGIFEPVVE